MGNADSYRASAGTSGTTVVKPSPPKAPRVTEKHLDAALLAVIRDRKLSILPGVPFH